MLIHGQILLKTKAALFGLVIIAIANLVGPNPEPSVSGGEMGSTISRPVSVSSLNSSIHENYLPFIYKTGTPIPRVNAPYFEGDIQFPETAIFWFGQVTPSENYADVRVGYNDTELYIHVAVFDRRLWYDESAVQTDLSNSDAVTILLDLAGDTAKVPGTSTYRFISQLNWWENRNSWQAVYQGSEMGWVPVSIPFTTSSGWRGNALNDDSDDYGWTTTFHIPFTSLMLSGPPSNRAFWAMSAILHDRDEIAGPPLSNKTWPEDINVNRPETWGRLYFGLPTYTPLPANPGGNVMIRHKYNAAEVIDSHVGGHTTCGQPYWSDIFNGWGEANYAGYEQINIQNQADVADWPCFSKYYVTFPLNAIPRGKIILSATLRLYEFGNSGQGWEPPPQPSLIQVLTVKQDWEESTITWNNAPSAFENVANTWVDPVDEFPGWPGIPWEWDVSKAVDGAYEAGEPLRLVLYSSDAAIHSGKYFISSDTGDWNAEGRPTLEVSWGDPR
jgi:hypothetical protein